MVKEYIPHYMVHSHHAPDREISLPEELEKLLQDLVVSGDVQLTVEGRDRIFDLLQANIDELESDTNRAYEEGWAAGNEEGAGAAHEKAIDAAVDEAKRVQKLFQAKHPDVSFDFTEHFNLS